MYDPNKPLWTATFAEIKEFLQEVGLTTMQIPEQKAGCQRGIHSLCKTLGIGRCKVMELKGKGIFKGSVWQECKGGAITFDPQLVVKQYAEYCTSINN